MTFTANAQKVQDTCVVPGSLRYFINGPEGMLYHWIAVNGSFATPDTLNDTIYIKWSNTGMHKLSVFGELGGCFTDTTNLTVNINSTPYLDLGEDEKLCQGETYTFLLPDGFTQYEWNNKTTGQYYTTDTTETIWAKVTNSYGCYGIDTAHVTVYEKPKINIGNDTMLCETTLTLSAGSSNKYSYLWSTGSIDSSITISEGLAEYSVIVTNQENPLCVSYDTIEISACNLVFDPKKVPSAITPDGSPGQNDYWELPGLSRYKNADVEVYDRWGRLVFKSKKGYPEPWDGKDQNNHDFLPMDSYYFIINTNEPGQSPIVGTILVIR